MLAAEDRAKKVKEAAFVGHEEQQGRRCDLADASDGVVGEHRFQCCRIVGINPISQAGLAVGEELWVAIGAVSGEKAVILFEIGWILLQGSVVDAGLYVDEALQYPVKGLVRERALLDLWWGGRAIQPLSNRPAKKSNFTMQSFRDGVK